MATLIPKFWNPTFFEKIITRILYLGAIQRACDIQLAWWIATAEAAPRTTIVIPKEVERKPWTKARKLKVFSTVIILLACLVGTVCAICLNANKVPNSYMNVFYGVLMLGLWTALCSTGLYGIFRRTLFIEKYRSGKSNRWAFRLKDDGSTSGFNWSNPRVGLVCGFFTALMILSAIYLEYEEVMPFGMAIGVLAYALRTNPPDAKLSIKGALGWTALPYAIFTILQIKDGIFPNKQDEKTGDGNLDNLLPSPQVFQFFVLWIHIVLATAPSKFMLINMRYEHSRLNPDIIAPVSKVNPPVLVRPTGILPLHHATFFALTLLFAGFDIAGWMGYLPSQFSIMASFLIAPPIAIVTSMVYTLFRGDFRQWWRYTEVWAEDIDWSVTSKIDEDGYEVEGEKEKGAMKA